MTGKRVWSYTTPECGDELVLSRIVNGPAGPGIEVRISSVAWGVAAVYLPDVVALGLGDELTRITTPVVDTDHI